MKKKLENDIKSKIFKLALELKKRRQYLGISQLKLGKLCNLSQSIINKFENNKIDPNYSTILKIEKALINQENISNLTVKEIMITKIASVEINSKISKVTQIMINNDYSQILVSEKNKITGCLYESTILEAISKKIDIYNTTIKKYIQTLPIKVPINYQVSDLNFIFQNKRTKFILVEDKEKIVGIITKSDLFKQ